MSGFLSNSTGLSIFQVDKPGSVTADGLKRYAFRNIDKSSEASSVGWTNIDDLTDAEWRLSPPEKGEFMCFSLRQDKRKVQPAVLKRVLREAMNEEMEKTRAEGREFVSRQRKKELKELHSARLLSRSMPVPSVTEAALDTTSGTLYVASASGSAVTALIETLQNSFGVKCAPLAETLGIEPDAACRAMVALYADGARVGEYTLEQDGQVRLLGEEMEVNAKNESQSVQAGLDAGLTICKLKVFMTGADSAEYRFTLGSDLALGGLKTPMVVKDADADPDALMLEKLYLIGQVKDVLTGLFSARA
jgi:DNA recombination-dependent growth factor C